MYNCVILLYKFQPGLPLFVYKLILNPNTVTKRIYLTYLIYIYALEKRKKKEKEGKNSLKNICIYIYIKK